ncbi:hypothetical protein HanIR_Chr04g0187031 [Helianthus annuus]|nr:hypothetical protein HanIR_Chr04g0187031 [Helianthus annuus]
MTLTMTVPPLSPSLAFGITPTIASSNKQCHQTSSPPLTPKPFASTAPRFFLLHLSPSLVGVLVV